MTKESRIKWYKTSLEVSKGIYRSMFLNFNEEIKSNETSLEAAIKSLGKIKSKYSEDREALSKLGHPTPLLQTQLDAYEILN